MLKDQEQHYISDALHLAIFLCVTLLLSIGVCRLEVPPNFVFGKLAERYGTGS